jgi:mannopine transport system substrate-binding protein
MKPVMEGIAGLAAVAGILMAQPSVGWTQQVVIATTGGDYEKVLREAWFDPFTKATGIKVVTVSATNTEMRARVKAMTESKTVIWDIYQDGELDSESDEHKAAAEDMTEFCKRFGSRADLLPTACKPSGVLFGLGATLLVYNADTFKDKGPQTWADVWNVKAFPGSRGFPNFSDAWRVLSIALLADGVPPSKLFPLDIDRAYKKLEEIKPNVGLWWRTGDQTTQGFRTGEYQIGLIWLTRATVLKKEGRPIRWSYNGALLVGDRYGVVKGTPNKAEAEKLLEFFLNSPETQARICEALTCTPPSRAAVAKMSPTAQEQMPTAEQVAQQMVVPDATWINKNRSALIERWNKWMQQ